MFGSRRVARNTQGAVASLSFHGYGVKEFENAAGFKIFYPSGTAANDIAVLFENALGSGPVDNPPVINEYFNPGWTKVFSQSMSIDDVTGTYTTRSQISYKVLTDFDNLTYLEGIPRINNMILLIFRPNAALLGATAYALDYQLTSGNPSQRTIAAQGGDVPLISFGWYASSFVIDPRYSSVTMTEVADNTNNWSFVKYKIYNVGDTPENINIDMDDESTSLDHINTLAGFYLKII